MLMAKYRNKMTLKKQFIIFKKIHVHRWQLGIESKKLSMAYWRIQIHSSCISVNFEPASICLIPTIFLPSLKGSKCSSQDSVLSKRTLRRANLPFMSLEVCLRLLYSFKTIFRPKVEHAYGHIFSTVSK